MAECGRRLRNIGVNQWITTLRVCGRAMLQPGIWPGRGSGNRWHSRPNHNTLRRITLRRQCRDGTGEHITHPRRRHARVARGIHAGPAV